MIVITKGNDIIHSDSSNGYTNAISPIITEEKNKVPTLSFQIVSENPCYNSVKNGDIITVEEDGKTIFRGRNKRITLDFNKNKKLDCVGEFEFLIDTIIRPFDTFTGSVRDILNVLMESHNSCADQDKQFAVGYVEIVGIYEFSNSDYMSTMEYIQNHVLSVIGGRIYFDYDQDGRRTINYRFNQTTSNQSIMYGSNMLDMSNVLDCTDMYTVLIPVGKDGLTINSIVGTDYIENQSGVALYGRKWKVVEYDTDNAHQLYEMALADINNGTSIIPAITLNAFDLYHMGSDFGAEKFEVGQLVNILSEPHGLNLTMEVQKIRRNLLNPTSSSIQVGQIEQGMTNKVQSAENRIEKEAQKGVGYPVERKDLAVDVQNSLNMFDLIGLSVVNGKIYDTWGE